MAGLGTKVTFLTLFTFKLLRLLMGKAAMRFIPTIRRDCNMCSGEKVRTAPVRKKPEMRNVGYYTQQHSNWQITQT